MLGVTKEREESRFYREIKAEGWAEGKAEACMLLVPMAIEIGFSVEEIADRLNLTLDQAHKFA
jgi:predicted transposase YdaD